jgi:hypothetical protein
MITETKTGKRRFRVHRNLFGKSWIVLQVEVKIEQNEHYVDRDGLIPKPAKPWSRVEWRDALLSDLTEHPEHKAVAMRSQDQKSRLKYTSVGFRTYALVLQVRTRFYVYESDPSREPVEEWRDAETSDFHIEFEKAAIPC